VQETIEPVLAQSSPYGPFSCKFPLRRDTKIGPRGWQHTKPNDYAYSHYGIAIQDAEIVLDFDPQNYPIDPITGDVLDPWLGFDGEPGLDTILPYTYMVTTPSGGHHCYYLKPAEIKISHKQLLYVGVDFQGKGRMVVGAGSHIKGEPYQAANSKEAIVQIPLDFLKTLSAPRIIDPIAADNFEDDDPITINHYKAWLGIRDPAIQGKNGNDTTLKTAYHGRDMGLSSYATYECMWDVYNPRCKPPWDANDLERIVNNAYSYAKGAQGSKSPIMLVKNDQLLNAIAPAPKEPDTETVTKLKSLRFDHLRDNYILNAKGGVLENNITNARYILENNTDFKDLLWYDEVSQRVRWEGKPWWRHGGNLDCNDDDMLHIYGWINSKAIAVIETDPKKSGYRCSEDTVRSAVKLVASKRSRNPLTDYLDKLEWDGEGRLDRYLIDTCGSPDDEWSKIAGRKWLIGAVTRAYEPGCQMDYVLVMQGEQGIKKSKWIETLGGDWASASHLNPDDKDLFMKMLGTWIMEVPEMNKSLRKHDLDQIKAFITVRQDNFRVPYGRLAERVPRLTVFIGSLNPSGLGFLKDITGDRRYWPINCVNCDPIKLRNMKDQLLAEAVLAYKTGERCDLSDAEVIHAKAAQDGVMERDPWYDELKTKITTERIPIKDIYHILGLAIKDINTNMRLRVYNTMKQVGYKYDRETQDWIKL
jgi:predicted P-loop ATPase